jgi:protein-S-isoprenylcysteine O-methyltransferase Ste14
MSSKLMSIVAFLVLIFVVASLAFQHSLFARNPIGIAVQVLAVLIILWARVTFGRRSFHFAANPTESGLVTTGPYRFLRHPIYSAFMYLLWAGVLSNLSAESFLLALIATAGIVVRMLMEERLLIKRYPEYKTYAARTKRVIPFVL